ncbi:alpha/beta hydrolase, partial [Aeromonas salmonicida]
MWHVHPALAPVPADRSTKMNKILLVPGLHNSGPDHWQSRWHQYFPHWQR